MSTVGESPQACAWTAWARPISPPSAVTALFRAMFCGLKGATRRPLRAKTRHSPVTSTLLPASEVVPWTIRVRAVKLIPAALLAFICGHHSLRTSGQCSREPSPLRLARGQTETQARGVLEGSHQHAQTGERL